MLATISQVVLFREVPAEGLMYLAEQGQPRTVRAGSQLMQQGDVGDSMYVIVKGRVRVERDHPQLTEPLVLAELGPGEVVGEMGLLDGEPRSASVTAIEETETVELSGTALAQMMLRFPEVSTRLLRTLSRHLQSTDELIEKMEKMLEKNQG